MEAIVRPLAWSGLPEQFRQVFGALRSPAGEQMVLDGDFFVEQMLPGGVPARAGEQGRGRGGEGAGDRPDGGIH
jgi:haloalkane dehalogenase